MNYMKDIVKYILPLMLSACATMKEGPNLVPTASSNAANYWCTWYAQNYWQQRGGEIKNLNMINNPNAREELTYEHVFNQKDGWATTYLPKGRQDMYFLIDHGWQTRPKESKVHNPFSPCR